MSGREVGTGYVPIKPDTDGFGKALEAGVDKEAAGAAKRSGEKARKVFAGAFAAGAALIGSSVMSAVGFEKQMGEVFTLLPDITKPAMSAMEDQVKDVAKTFGILPDKVVPAFYQSLSAGVSQDNVFSFVSTSAKLAQGGVTELETAVDGLSSVVNAYGPKVLSAEKASDLMFTTVKLGKTTIADLSAALFNVTPTAAGVGVSFDQISAALAAMTLQGVPTSVATTQLRQLLVELSKDGTKTATTFEKLAGKSFRDFMASGGNLADALGLMSKEADRTGVSLSDMFGSVEAGNAALALGGTGAQTFRDDLAAMKDASGATDKAFQRMQGTSAAAAARMRAQFAVLKLELGETLLPVFAMIVDKLAKLFGLFSSMPKGLRTAIVLFATLGAGALAFAKPMAKIVESAKLLGSAFNLLAANPWTIVILAIAVATLLIIKHWEEVKRVLGEVWTFLQTAGAATAQALSTAWTASLSAVKMATQDVAHVFGSMVSGVEHGAERVGAAIEGGIRRAEQAVSETVGRIVGLVTSVPEKIGAVFHGLAELISAPFRLAFSAIKLAWNSTVGGFGFSVPGWVPGLGGKGFHIPSMELGGVATAPMLALIGEYAGAKRDPEVVTPKSLMRDTMTEVLNDSRGSGDTFTFQLYVSSEVRDPTFFEDRARDMVKAGIRERERIARGAGTPTLPGKTAA